MGWMVLQGRRVLSISKGVLWGWLVLEHTGFILKSKATTKKAQAAEAETPIPGASNSVTVQNNFRLAPKGTWEVGRHVPTTAGSAYMVSRVWLGGFCMCYYREKVRAKSHVLGRAARTARVASHPKTREYC
jgi:hypothetical protein